MKKPEDVVNWLRSNSNTVWGVVFIVIGSGILWSYRSVVVPAVIFMIGLLLVYAGLRLANLQGIVSIIDNFVDAIKRKIM